MTTKCTEMEGWKISPQSSCRQPVEISWEWVSNGCLQYVSKQVLFSQKHYTMQNISLNISISFWQPSTTWQTVVKFNNLYFIKTKVHVFTITHRQRHRNTQGLPAIDFRSLVILIIVFQTDDLVSAESFQFPHQLKLHAGIGTTNCRF